ncbi:MAG: glycosyltransferase family 2 protein [Pseudomonadota bacterium]
MSRPTVSAIIVSFHTGPRLKECLYSLLSDPDVDEIVIIDNGNPDDMTTWLSQFARQHSAVRLIVGHGNVGFGAGINRGVAIAKGPHLLILNPDAALRWNSLPGMQAVAETCPTPWIIGGKIYDLYGREERGARRKKLTLWRAVTSFVGWNTWTLEHRPPPEGPVDMPVISGAFFLTSTASMATLGGFDEAYFLHVEDVDLCRRCGEQGGRVIYDPRAGALHYGSTSGAPSAVVQRHKADGLAYYFRKFAHGPLEKLIVASVLPLMRLGLALTRR